MKPLTATPGTLVVTVFACGILACTECDGSVVAAQPKFGRPASPAVAVGRLPPKADGAVSRASSLPATCARTSIVRKSCDHKPLVAKPIPGVGPQVVQRRAEARGTDLLPAAVKHHEQTTFVDGKAQVAAHSEKSSFVENRQAVSRKTLNQVASERRTSKRQIAMLGLASFYSEDAWTASGDRFDKHQLTAAHPTLAFGTRLRVTNVQNGRSVTVRVNDRGPFAGGRIIDVTSAAAEALGMVDAGVAKVTLDIIR